MRLRSSISLLPVLTVALAGMFPLCASAAVPVLLNPIAKENGSTRVTPTIPVGKTLVLPLLASDADGDLLNFTVTSSNPKIMARVRTGCPILKIHVSYAGDPAHKDADMMPAPVAAFEGDMEFQLFRDATPATSGVVGGAAQSGFYDNVIFHRVVPGFIIQGGDPTGSGGGDPGFSIGHEFRPELIFSGRGQLAMANSGGGYERGNPFGGGYIQLGNFSGTNSTQFFVTIAQPRFLDFKHTIFGQLIRGFDILDKVVALPTNLDGLPNTADDSKPTVPVKMSTVSLTPGTADATLLLTASDVGAATLTVTATDPSGGKAVRMIGVSATKDKFNDPPLLLPIPNLITSVGTAPTLPLKAIDLEHDYLLYGIASASGNTASGSFGFAQISGNFTPRTTPGFQDLALGVAGFNDPLINGAASASNPFAPFDPYRFQVAEIAYGDRAIEASAVNVEGLAGIAMTDAIIAEFGDGDPAGQAADFAAFVIWGDGSAEDASTKSSPKVRIERSAKTPGTFVVRGTHTFARAGVYTIQINVDGALGATDRVRSQAVIAVSGAKLRAVGATVNNVGSTVNDRVLATFTDTTSGAEVDDFSGRIDWGDGRISRATIVANGAGRFAVKGSHTYLDAETFAVNVHIKRTAPDLDQAVAWSRVVLSGFKGPQHLPPFSLPNIVGQISTAVDAAGAEVPFKDTTGTGATSETKFALSIIMLNSGDVASKEGKLRFYLSKNTKLNLKDVDLAGTANDSPADIPLSIGTFPEGNLPALQAGQALRYNLVPTTDSAGKPLDLRLVAPKGRTGSGYYILARLDYSDELTDKMPISKDVVFGRINGILVDNRSLTVTEANGAAHTAKFTIVLDAKPDDDVTIPITLSDSTQITADKTQVKFTRFDWDRPKTVTVTAINDPDDDGTKVTTVTLGPATSNDVSWSRMSGGTVKVFATDDDPTP